MFFFSVNCFTFTISYSYVTRKVKVFVFHYFPTKSLFYLPLQLLSHFFHFIFSEIHTCTHTYLISKEPYAAICAPYYYIVLPYILVNNWLKSIMKSYGLENLTRGPLRYRYRFKAGNKNSILIITNLIWWLSTSLLTKAFKMAVIR